MFDPNFDPDKKGIVWRVARIYNKVRYTFPVLSGRFGFAQDFPSQRVAQWASDPYVERVWTEANRCP